MYYTTNDYSITYRFLDDIEEKFVQYMIDYIKMKPFIWNEITNKILYNRLITYVKDTTFIITLYDIKNKNMKSLFDLLKNLLRKGYINKLIYKKEFIITHLYSELVVKVLSEYNYWLVIMTYDIIKKSYNTFQFYLNPIYQTSIKKITLDGIIFINEDPKLIITTSLKNLKNLDLLEILLIYLFNTKDEINEEFINKIKFEYDDKFVTNLNNYFKKFIC